MAVVTVTQTGAAVTVTPTVTTSSSSTLSAGSIAGIVIGTLVAGVLFICLVLYLLNRHARHKFSRVANPAPDRVPASNQFTKSKNVPHRLQRPSISSEPLIAPESWPPLPISRIQSPGTPPRSDSVSPRIGDGQNASYDLAFGRPLVRHETPPKPQQNLFVHRMLKSRAQASEGVALSHQPSLQSRSATLSSEFHVDVEQLLADAERTALRDAQMRKVEEGEEEAASTESMYSQSSAPVDHAALLDRQNTLPRRRARTPDLAPVVEVPDMPTTVATASLDGQVSHGTASRPTSSVVDGPVHFPLLTSANFGKESTTTGSMSSNAGWTSNSSGRASRYPSLAPSSLGRSDDWHHAPSGLAGLTSLQAGPLRNPHSPVEKPRELREDGVRARLREGTVVSIPEVEHRKVVQGGIARIDVAL